MPHCAECEAQAMKAAHILVVDDDERLRKLLQRFLLEHGAQVSVAADGLEAQQMMRWFRFDMLIVDVMMPGMTGLELVHAIRQESQVPVLMLSALGEADDRVRGLEQGADDYLPKPFEPRELILKVERMIRRNRPVAPTSVMFGPFRWDKARKLLWRGSQSIHLTGAETTLLEALAEKPGQPLTRDELARLLDLPADGQSERGVDVHVTRLRRKIETDPKQPIYIRTQRGAGYSLQASGVGA
ncbi:response regulator [bacterium]|nr:response regulator [bacterium]